MDASVGTMLGVSVSSPAYRKYILFPIKLTSKAPGTRAVCAPAFRIGVIDLLHTCCRNMRSDFKRGKKRPAGLGQIRMLGPLGVCCSGGPISVHASFPSWALI